MAIKKDPLYLDHNATSILRPEAFARMAEVFGAPYNASSTHSMGRAAKELLSEARRILSDTITCAQEDVIFTSGGTESNNLVLNASWDQVFCSATEHDSLYKSDRSEKIPVLKSGILDLDALDKKLGGKKEGKTLVSVHWANNETGIIQPIEEIVKIAHRYGAFVHSDGVQALGKIPLSFQGSGLDFLSLSAHKMGGPQGVGALIRKKEHTLNPLFLGGGQERSLRPGTENIAAIVGFGEALKYIDLGVFKNLEKCHRALELDLALFSKQHGRETFIVGKEEKRVANTTCFTMPETSNQSQLIYFDLEGVNVSIGSACSSRSVKPSHVLKNMGLSEEVIGSAIRISSGWTTTESDFVRFKKDWMALFLKQG
ncbi:cysteine desulfurase [Alphaproteobacteria bacterium]|nr:cysteine desulfurase [Alphaproteobacteria bacterium]